MPLRAHNSSDPPLVRNNKSLISEVLREWDIVTRFSEHASYDLELKFEPISRTI